MPLRWRVQNDTAKTLIVGSFGIQDNMTARLRVPANSIRELRDAAGNFLLLTEGNRMFVAWDDFADDIINSAEFRVDSAAGSAMTVLVTDTGMDVSFS